MSNIEAKMAQLQTASSIKDARELDAIQDRLRHLLERQNVVWGRLNSVMERLHGATPTTDATAGRGEAPCEGMIAEINSVIAALEHVTNCLEGNATQAERI